MGLRELAARNTSYLQMTQTRDKGPMAQTRDQEMRGILRQSQMFWRLSDDQLDKLVAISDGACHGPGESIFAAGDSARKVYVIVEGRVALEMAIRIGSRTRKQATIDVLGAGEVFGWSALTEKRILTMSAVATENTRLLTLDGDDLRNLWNEDADICRKMADELVNLVSDRLAHTKRTLAHVLGVASHDLRAPLATVQSCLDVLLGGFTGELNSKQTELLAGSRQRISDLMSLTDNVLDISYIEIRQVDFEKTSLSELVENSIADVQGIAVRKNIQIENHVAPELPPILGVPKRLRQVIMNLLSNAVKYTPADGKVTVHSSETDDSVQLHITDTGIGIATEELARVFDDFYRGSRGDAEGAGLGLSIAKKIVESHGGLIWAESPCPETGLGTKLTIALPKVALEATKADSGRSVTTGARILVADDDPEMLRVTTLVLESGGFQISAARDGIEALSKVDADNPDLLILDLMMPEMDGFEVLKRLRERDRTGRGRIPVLVLSAVREGSSRRRYELETSSDLGADGYLEKPISPPLLLNEVNRILTEKGSKICHQAR
jgi:signal transduction histidine kinase/CheY-like chemotaxis protein